MSGQVVDWCVIGVTDTVLLLGQVEAFQLRSWFPGRPTFPPLSVAMASGCRVSVSVATCAIESSLREPLPLIWVG